MHTSGGSGYCDCGDEEAWSQHVHCDLHRPVATDDDQMDVDQPECVLDEADEKRLPLNSYVHIYLVPHHT